jgi:DnaJ-class molecular chaperone
MLKNYYEILGVEKTATSQEIKIAYRKLALQHHPDKGGSEAKFKELVEAYEILSDPVTRQKYDETGSAPPKSSLGGITAPSTFDYDQKRFIYETIKKALSKNDI